MNLFVMCIALICASVLQAVAPVWALLGQAKFPVLAMVVVYYALARSRHDVLTAAIIAGLMQDGLGVMPFGYSSFAFCVMGVFIYRVRQYLFAHETFTHVLVGMWMGAGYIAILYGLLTGTGLLAIPFTAGLHKILGSALLGGVLAPFVFKACTHLDHTMGLAEKFDSSWQELP